MVHSNPQIEFNSSYLGAGGGIQNTDIWASPPFTKSSGKPRHMNFEKLLGYSEV